MGGASIQAAPEMPRVLVTGLSDGLGGTEVVVGRYVSALRDRFEFDFMATSDLSSVAYAHEAGSRVFRSPDIKQASERRRYLKRFFGENGSRYQAVWCNFNHLLYSDVLREARLSGVPVRVAHAHNSKFLGSAPVRALSAMLRGRAKSDATALLACSGEAGNFFWGDSFTVLPNAMDFSTLAFSQAERERVRREFSFAEDDVVVCSVGRLTDQKNHEFLIRLLPDLRKAVPTARLLLVGDGVLRGKLEELSRSLGLGDLVVFAGERRDIKGVLSASDVFAFPSIFEGLGVAAIEAQANGLPCICSTNVPDEACVSDKFVKLLLEPGAWVECIASTSRLNKLAGGRLYMRSAPKSRHLSQSCTGARPLVSVVIPMYNAGETILGALGSVQGQDCADIEIIVVDDGSRDQGPAIVSAEADKDARIRLVRQENQGVAVARNRGIEESRGQWVTFVDADDELCPRALTSMLEASHGKEIVIGSMDTGDGSSGGHREMDPSAACALCLAFWDNRTAAPYPSFRHGAVFRSVWGKLFSGDLVRGRTLRFETGVRFGEDALFMADAYRTAEGIEVLDRPVYRYVCNPGSVTRKADVSMIEGVAVLLGRLYRLSEERSEIGDLYRQSAVREVLTLIRCCAGLDGRSCLAGLEDLTGRPYFKPLMRGYRRHRYSKSRAAEVKNWIVIGLLSSGRAAEAIAFARIVFGRRA